MNFLQDLTITAFVTRLTGMVLFSGVLGFMLALCARLMGDRRPRHEGRLTLNPFAHVSPTGLLVATLFGMGWIRVMRFDARQNRWGVPGLVLALLGGMFLSLLTVPLVDVLRRIAVDTLPLSGVQAVVLVLRQYQMLAAATVVLNLLPLPGLVLGAIWPALMPDREKRITRKEPIALAIVAAAIVAGFIGNPGSALLPYITGLN